MPTTQIVKIESLAFGGEGVGRIGGSDGQVVFVAGTAPGDVVEVELLPQKKERWARGRLLRVVEAGERIAPPCRYVEACGGCPWQHVTASAQLAAKQAIVARALARFSGITVEPLVPAPAPLGYRTRARLTVRGGALGFFGRRSHDLVDVASCLALVPALDAALQRVRALGLPDESEVAGLVAPDGRVQLRLTTTRPVDAAALLDDTVVGVVVDTGGRPQVFGAATIAVDGWQAEAGGFAQANWAQNRFLVEAVGEAVRQASPTRVVELYAGAGNLTGALLDACAQGVAVEGAPDAARALQKRVAAHEHGAGWRVRSESDARTAGWLASAASTFDVAVLDPPRAGAKALVGALGQVRRRIVYVSCDPMTLQRDVTALTATGFSSGRAWPVDMMPQTAHVEVVCVLDRVAYVSENLL